MEQTKSLAELAVQYGSDKHGHHYYCEHYEKHFMPFKYKGCVFLELGIGGYHHPDKGGAGLKMWRDWFTNARVIGIDLYDKSQIDFPHTGKLTIAKGSQADPVFLSHVIGKNPPDIIVDDASHNNRLTVKSFEILFPQLNHGGIYVIEDMETSWWNHPEFQGCSDYNNFKAPTTINLVRELINDVMRRKVPGYQSKYAIKAIHMYDNIVFIEKEEN